MLKYLLAKMYAIGLALFFGGIFLLIRRLMVQILMSYDCFFDNYFFQHNTDIHTYMLYTGKFVLKKIIK